MLPDDDPLTVALREAAHGDKEAQERFWRLRAERKQAADDLLRDAHAWARRSLGID